MKHVRSAAEMMYPQLRIDNLVILGSTVPPGTCAKLLVQVLEESGLNVLRIVKRRVDDIKDPLITVFGVAYKGGVDDTRETPALKFIKLAENEGYKVKVHDPQVKGFDYEVLGLEEAVKDSDCIVSITDHLEFKIIGVKDISALMRNMNVVDTRKMLDAKRWEEAGFSVNVLGVGH